MFKYLRFCKSTFYTVPVLSAETPMFFPHGLREMRGRTGQLLVSTAGMQNNLLVLFWLQGKTDKTELCILSKVGVLFLGVTQSFRRQGE